MLRITRSMFLTGCACLLASACSGQPDAQEFGDLEMKLVAHDSQGTEYRLRNAEFLVQGYGYYDDYYEDYATPTASAMASPAIGIPIEPADAGVSVEPPDIEDNDSLIVLSSEADPNSSVISQRLLRGDYDVFLRNGWYMERTTSEGETEVVDAVLLNSRTQYVYIYPNSKSSVRYRFGVDGTELDFLGGDLEIEIEIVRPEDLQDNGDWGPTDAGVADWGAAPRAK